jgi:hypothetical protein
MDLWKNMASLCREWYFVCGVDYTVILIKLRKKRKGIDRSVDGNGTRITTTKRGNTRPALPLSPQIKGKENVSPE